ncbi:hypothetical protein Barb4_05402 [Bacteroidales bacterium Barb4]|nr:hypothetical protein Barb4_05402 [Bacteroidales bacterium Barb4]
MIQIQTIFTMQPVTIYIIVLSGLPFRQHQLTPHSADPTFRYAACGAEIFCPFGASARDAPTATVPFLCATAQMP